MIFTHLKAQVETDAPEFTTLVERWNEKDLAFQREIVEAFIERVEYGPDRALTIHRLD